MKILLFGGSGQLGYEVTTRCHDLNFELIAPVVSEVDIGNEEQALFLAKRIQPDVIVNAAAYTAVDQAEDDVEEAFRINRDGARNVATAAKEINCRLIHISTDYVYDGEFSAPIKEGSPTNPLSVYGASKLAGDKEVERVLQDKALVLRTSSLHGQKGVNFVGTMIKLFKEREHVSVVSDQFMSPTYAGWLAEVIIDLSKMKVGGLFHASCSGVISWYEFAQAIYQNVQATGKENLIAELHPVPMSEFQRPAKRPRYSAMDCSKLASLLGREPLSWQVGLKAHLREIGYPSDG